MSGDDPAAASMQRLSQLMLIAMNVGVELARLRAARAEDRATRDKAVATAARAEFATLRAGASARWGAALDPRWLSRAGTLDVAAAWAAASPWATYGDPEAETAMTAAETRLRDLHPDAMATYDQARRAGAGPEAAMKAAAPQMAADPDVYEWKPGMGQPYAGRPGPDRRQRGLSTSPPNPDLAPVRLAKQAYPQPIPTLTHPGNRSGAINSSVHAPTATPTRMRTR